MQLVLRWLLAVLLLLVSAIPARSQGPSNDRSLVAFVGEVEEVFLPEGKIRAKHPAISGMAGAGISEFSVPDRDALTKLQPGDAIRATADPQKQTLSNIKLIYRNWKRTSPGQKR